jgi:UDP-N-acetylmuramoyl-tripeptide--D-alanyl-D-alanine ligase
MNIVSALGGGRILDDSANATPESLMHALETLRALPSARRIAVIGDIANLGRTTERIHRQIGRLAAQTASMVIAVGLDMRWAGGEALQAGSDVHHFDTADEVGKWLGDFLQADDTILVSGGRAMHMEQVVERLRG